MKIKELIKQYGGAIPAAKACGASQTTVNTWAHKDREVLELANGDYILVSGRTVIFKRA